jgi:hypothetical protein
LRTNEYYAKRAVESNGLFLEHANKLRNNKEICLIALKQNRESFIHLGQHITHDEEFLKELFCQNQKYWFNILKDCIEHKQPYSKMFTKDDFFKENMSKLASDFPNEISKYINHMSKSMLFQAFTRIEIEKFFEDDLRYERRARWRWEWPVKSKRIVNPIEFFRKKLF